MLPSELKEHVDTEKESGDFALMAEALRLIKEELQEMAEGCRKIAREISRNKI